jgi:hypothetical protein
LQHTDELTVNNITLEHIESQKINKEWVLSIGNIIPLSKVINQEVGTKKLSEKIIEFRKSELRYVNQFCKEYATTEFWTEDLTERRINNIAEITYNISKF